MKNLVVTLMLFGSATQAATLNCITQSSYTKYQTRLFIENSKVSISRASGPRTVGISVKKLEIHGSLTSPASFENEQEGWSFNETRDNGSDQNGRAFEARLTHSHQGVINVDEQMLCLEKQ